MLTALIAALLAVIAQPTAAEASADFARHPVAQDHSGRRPALRLHDARSRRLRSAIDEAYDGQVDFAGHYVLAEIGCGAGCIEVAALDTRTGAVRWLPGRVSDWPKAYPDPLEHRADSRLLIVHGRLGERAGDGPHAFTFDGRRFVPR